MRTGIADCRMGNVIRDKDVVEKADKLAWRRWLSLETRSSGEYLAEPVPY